MSSPRITEGVMSVMTNPQNQAENGCNRCNDYITSITPNKSAPHNKDEVKALYLKFRASGVDPTANILHQAIGGMVLFLHCNALQINSMKLM